MNEAVLVTGGHGFVGMHVVKDLLEKGRHVFVNDVVEKPPSLLAPYAERYTFVPGDLTDYEFVERLVEGRGIGSIVHLAAIKSEPACAKMPLQAFMVNFVTTLNMLEAVRVKALRRLIVFSTGAVFGGCGEDLRPLGEDEPVSPAGLYPVTKLCVEQAIRVYREMYGVPAVAVRLSRSYGPGITPRDMARSSNPIPIFLWDIVTKNTIDEPTGGDFAADFGYVRDVSRGIVLALDAAALPSPLLNISSGRLVTVAEVVEAIRRLCPDCTARVGPTTEPYTQQCPMRGPLDNGRAAEEIGYRPEYTLEAGLKEYLQWLRREYEQQEG